MKYFSKITLGLILCMGIISSCKDDDETRIDGISLDKEEIAIGAEGGTEKIAVSSNDQWVYAFLNLGLPFHRQTVLVQRYVNLP